MHRSHVTLTVARSMSSEDMEAMRKMSNACSVTRIPTRVQEAYARERALNFNDSSEPPVGQLLAVLAATVPSGGRILELGTGAGVGLAWMVEALGSRTDVDLRTIELNSEQAAVVRSTGWPDWVSIIVGNADTLIGTLGSFDLIFADSPGGKVYDLSSTIAILRPGGILVMDDMGISDEDSRDRTSRLARVRKELQNNPALVIAELEISTGVIVAAKRR